MNGRVVRSLAGDPAGARGACVRMDFPHVSAGAAWQLGAGRDDPRTVCVAYYMTTVVLMSERAKWT